jgi:carboxyl-terminal processing protease
MVKLYYKATISGFVYGYYVQNRAYFNSIQNPGELAGKFVPGEKEWASLVAYARKDSIALNTMNVKGKNEVLKRVQVMMARQIWRTEGYFEISNRNDETVKKALEGMK